MNVLNGSEPLSGPHYFQKVKHRSKNVYVYLMGEEHSNNHQCYRDGADVGDVLRAAVSDMTYRVGIYVEMPQTYEYNEDPNVMCSAKPVGTPRKDVLNTIRSCMLQKRNSSSTPREVRSRINFTDIREFFGLLPYTERENSCINEIRSETVERAWPLLNKYFVSPISDALCTLGGVDDRFRNLIYYMPEDRMSPYDYFIHENWHRSLMPLAQTVAFQYTNFSHDRRRSSSRILSCYRHMMDLFTDIYTTWRILSDVDSGIVTHAVFYGGSSHAVAIARLLENTGFVTELLFRAAILRIDMNMNRDQCTAFLKDVVCTQGVTATHLNMVGGAYNISEDLNKNFMHAYSTYIECNKYQPNAYQHLTEVVSRKSPYFVDLDILDPFDKCADPPADDDGGAMHDMNCPPDLNMIHRWTCAINVALAECIPSALPDDAEIPSALPDDAEDDDPTGGDSMSDEEETEEETYYCPPSLGGCDIIFNGINVISDRDGLSPLDCIVATAPIRTLTKNGVSYRKTGVHIVWPTMIVTKQLANVIRAIIIAALFEFDKTERKRDKGYYCRDWTSIVDEAVYKNMSSLRMIGSYKSCRCDDCATDEMKKKYAELATLLVEFQCMVSINNVRITNAKKVTEKAAVKHARAIVRTEKSNNMRAGKDLITRASKFILLSETMTCPCKGRLKATDVGAGVYSVKIVVNGDGSRNSLFEEIMANDNLIMTYAMSVRRPEITALTPVKFPPHAPVAYTVQMEELETDDDDARAVKVKRGHPLPKVMTTARYREEEIHSVAIRDAAENYIRAGWVGPEYSRVQVRRIYKLYNPKKKSSELDVNQDGSDSCSVIAVVEGFGSSFCRTVNRDHTSSTIYFEFTPDRRCLQRCRSTKNTNCKRAAKEAFNVDYRVYVSLFPYTLRTARVLPEEEKDWQNKSLPRSYLKNFLEPRDVDMIPRTGPVFKAVLGLARTSSARKKKASDAARLALGSVGPEADETDTGAATGVKRKRSGGRSSNSTSTNSMSPVLACCNVKLGDSKACIASLIAAMHAQMCDHPFMTADGCGAVLIEQQCGHVSPKNFALSAALYMFYQQRLDAGAISSLQFVNPRVKFSRLAQMDLPALAQFKDELVQCRGKELKKLSVKCAIELARAWNCTVFQEAMIRVKKQDDLSDAMLYAVTHF
ncbi:hypothetical protein JKP88DRAFT_296229 [Tribonema minus]|uniref:C962R-like N-terminal AEP domain-containing protein n=1 Tax=Tribonema minus TaxID=303371 RepID=A0A836CLZ6_9STRA|nr:hypothetical protein JKP88DRAFT_296229 [Tribonema minus]